MSQSSDQSTSASKKRESILKRTEEYCQKMEEHAECVDETTLNIPLTFQNRVVSFKDFLKKVRVYDAKNIRFFTYYIDTVRFNATLLRGSEDKIALHDLVSKAQHSVVPKQSIQEFYEALIWDNIDDVSFGTSIVRLGSRRYAVLNSEDFNLLKGQYGVSLLCFKPSKLKIVEMSSSKSELAEGSLTMPHTSFVGMRKLLDSIEEANRLLKTGSSGLGKRIAKMDTNLVSK